MEFISLFGYSTFPLTGNKTVMNFQNMMHIAVTVSVIFTTIASVFTLAYGYLKEEKLKIGKFILIMAIIITVAGLTNPIGISKGLNILGLTERLVIYPLQVLYLYLSYYYTFNLDNNHNEEV